MYKHFIVSTSAVLAALALTGCASMPGLAGYGYDGYNNQRPYPNSANIYTPSESQKIAQVRLGTVVAVQPVEIQTAGNTKLAGDGIGAVAGGLLGNQVGGSKGKTLATMAGVLGGAVAGNAIASHHYAQEGLQISIKLDNSGGDIAVTQQTGPMFAVGQRVEVIGGSWNSPARVEPLN